MEIRFSSLMLLLSCSLHQSLLGILASVPHTDAKKCQHKLSSKGEPVKKVQMIRRIPARCSGWDEAWSWISKKDCHTKYILDYVELPSAVQRDDEDCEEELSVPAPSNQFDITDEKFLAITFGSATLALLIIVVIIVVSVMRRGNYRCTCCGGGPAYISANVVDRENPNEIRNCNLYEGNTPDGDHIYEEVFDKTKVNIDDKEPSDINMYVPKEDIKSKTSNGVHQRRPVTPTAPLEEDVTNTAGIAQPNEYSVLKETLVKSVDKHTNISENVSVYTHDTQLSTRIAADSDKNILDAKPRSEGAYKNIDNELNHEDLERDSLLCKEHNTFNFSGLEHRLEELNVTSNVYSEFESLLKEDVIEIMQLNAEKADVVEVVQDRDKHSATDKITVDLISEDNHVCKLVHHDKHDDVETQVNALNSATEIYNQDNVSDHGDSAILCIIGTNQSSCNGLYSETVDATGNSSFEPICPNDGVVLGSASEHEDQIVKINESRDSE